MKGGKRVDTASVRTKNINKAHKVTKREVLYKNGHPYLRELQAGKKRYCSDSELHQRTQIPIIIETQTSGIRILNRVPTPNLLFTSMDPLWASAIFLHILNPKPLPPSPRERALSTR